MVLFDSERIIQTGRNNLSLSYENFKLEIINNLNKNKQVICIIVGVDKFINDLEDGENDFYETLKTTEELGNYNFILVDNFSKLKNREYDEWYKNYIIGDSGIWVGNGINDQYLINLNVNGMDLVNNCGSSFGYAIVRETPELIKLLGMKDEGENNG